MFLRGPDILKEPLLVNITHSLELPLTRAYQCSAARYQHFQHISFVFLLEHGSNLGFVKARKGSPWRNAEMQCFDAILYLWELINTSQLLSISFILFKQISFKLHKQFYSVTMFLSLNIVIFLSALEVIII